MDPSPNQPWPPSEEQEEQPAGDGGRLTIIQRLPVSVSVLESGDRRLDDERRQPLRPGIMHPILFVLTFLSTALVGFLLFSSDKSSFRESLGSGLLYAFTIMVILTAHEMGHYVACRWYGVEATWPYFIPLPFSPVGTLGAFIRMRSPIPDRRALFDIGIAGPLAGFIFIVPAAIVSHYFAGPSAMTGPSDGMIYLQSPLLFRIFEWAFGLPETVELNPVMWAAWVGALMTSLNLLPVGQLDGGHVTWAIFGRRGHRLIMFVAWFGVIGLAIHSLLSGLWNWVVYAVLLTVLVRVGHPPVLDDREPLGASRLLVALIGLLVFILCFMPAPISFQ